MFKKFEFKKSSSRKENVVSESGWKVLIVDDEPEVHAITKIALGEFEFERKSLALLSAHSADEAKAVIDVNPDIALIYLDVVMETDDAGLRVVKYVREELNNKFVRIILRTGQPGQAPERDVIVNYDINGYKEKTSFDSNKLFTSTYAALRAYQDIMNLELSRRSLDRHRMGLEEVIEATANLFEIRSLNQFASGLLVQLGTILHIDQDTLLVRCNGWTVTQDHGVFQVLAGTGSFSDSAENKTPLPDRVLAFFNRACRDSTSIFEDDKFIGYFPTKSGKINLIYLDGVAHLDELDKKLIQVFSSNVTIAFDNLYLDREIVETQAEIIHTLGEVVESRSSEAANHVKRVAHFARLLANASGLSAEDSELLFMAAPMHDVGKVAIPDSILLKPGKLDAEEWQTMRNHAAIGQTIFTQSSRPILKAAAIVAGQHHEKFDGSGYPDGLTGDAIHVFGRIVAVADVFDALIHQRCYKSAWPIEDVIALLIAEKGKHFDPVLVDLFLDHIEEVKCIMTIYHD